MMHSDSRRNFLKLAAAGGLTAAAEADTTVLPPPPHLPPLPETRLQLKTTTQCLPRPLLSTPEGQAQVDKMLAAYDVLLARDPKDPTSLKRQMWLHDSSCSGPMDVHASYAFLPWHRALLYFHERVLSKVIGDDSFRIPVWDWENNAEVPPKYQDWVRTRLKPHTRSNLGNQFTHCSIESWLFSESFEDFAGYPPHYMSGGQAPAGKAPLGTHSFVHTQIGGLLSQSETAAVDPLFYAHHANVDRFWISWRKTHPDFTIPAGFATQKLYLYDDQGQGGYVLAEDVLDESKLGYGYTSPKIQPPKLARRIMERDVLKIEDAAGFFNDAHDGIMETLSAYAKLAFTSLDEAMHSGSAQFDLPFSIRWVPAKKLIPNQTYFIAVTSGTQTRVVAAFGTFGAHGTVLATGCLSWADLLFLRQQKNIQISYGPADGNMVGIEGEPTPIWPAHLTLLHPGA